MKKKIFISSFLAGIFISIGGCVNLLSPNNIIGAIMFSIGLYSIVCFSFSLFTGQVGYWIDNGLTFAQKLGIILLGNFVGTFVSGIVLSLTRHESIVQGATALSTVKLADTPQSIFILSIFCGILMFTAVELYRRTKNPLGIFVCVPVFILSGFEHCVANMFYISAASMWSIKAVFYMIIMILGNTAGGLLIPALLKLKDKIK